MVTQEQDITSRSQALDKEPEARSLSFAQNGIKTGEDFANTMSALMSDLLTGAVKPEVGNAVCNAGGKLLKVVEMRLKYATEPEATKRPDLTLAEPGD